MSVSGIASARTRTPPAMVTSPASERSLPLRSFRRPVPGREIFYHLGADVWRSSRTYPPRGSRARRQEVFVCSCSGRSPPATRITPRRAAGVAAFALGTLSRLLASAALPPASPSDRLPLVHPTGTVTCTTSSSSLVAGA